MSKKKPKYIRPWYIVSHYSKYKISWDLIWAVILLISYFLSLYTIAFDGEPLKNNRQFEIFLDILQLFDIILMFLTTREDFKGQIIEKPWSIAR